VQSRQAQDRKDTGTPLGFFENGNFLSARERHSKQTHKWTRAVSQKFADCGMRPLPAAQWTLRKGVGTLVNAVGRTFSRVRPPSINRWHGEPQSSCVTYCIGDEAYQEQTRRFLLEAKRFGLSKTHKNGVKPDFRTNIQGTLCISIALVLSRHDRERRFSPRVRVQLSSDVSTFPSGPLSGEICRASLPEVASHEFCARLREWLHYTTTIVILYCRGAV
jgi:hypothetical protein